MVGMASQNENSAAARRSAPSSIADTMVAPGARDAGDHRHALRQPDDQIHRQREARRVVIARLEIEPVDPKQNRRRRRSAMTHTIQGLNSTSLMNL